LPLRLSVTRSREQACRMPEAKENRKHLAEMISKSHREGVIQTLARAIVNLYDHIESLNTKLEAARKKIRNLEERLAELEG
jgi:predicted RNase H-like nuclease (RuvC/YqgF family)